MVDQSTEPTDPALAPTDHWLVRTSNNVIAGPYSGDEIRQLIREGNLTQRDEVCAGNSYWFFLHEHDEVTAQLKTEVPAESVYKLEGEETTVTDVDRTERAIPIVGDVPELDGLSEEEARTLVEERNEALRKFKKRKSQPTRLFKPKILGKIEGTFFWKVVTTFLSAAVVFLMFLILKLLRFG